MKKLNVKPLSPIRTTKEIVYKKLKQAILNGEISKNTIFTETELADAFDTSRTPIREATSDLLKDGLLISIPRKGYKIREITKSEEEQIILLRLAIETESLNKLQDSISQKQISELRLIIQEQVTAMENNDQISFIELDQVFHRTIVHFSNLFLLEEIFQNLYNLTRLIGHKALMKEGRMIEVIQEHNFIIQALENNQGEKAIQYLKLHLTKTIGVCNVVKKDQRNPLL